MLTRFKAVLFRIDETPEADIVGAVFVFALPLLVLAFGQLVDGGM